MPHVPRPLSRRCPGRARVASLAFVSLVLGLAALVVGATPAAAMSVDEYRSALREIRDAADLDEDTPLRAVALASTIDAVLPEGETVDLGGTRLPVRDPELTDLGERLAAARSSSGIRIAAEEVEERANALLDAIGTGTVVDVPEDRAALEAIVGEEDAEAGKTLSDLILELAEKIAEWVGKLLSGLPGVSVPDAPDVDLTGAWPYVVGLAAAVAAGLLVRLAMWIVARRRVNRAATTAEDATPVVAAAEDLPPDVLAHVEKLAAAGRFREAVRALFGGAARTLVDVGVIARTKTRTNGELLGDIRASAPAVADDVDRLARIFESAWYGRRDPGRTGLDHAREHYTAIIESAGRWSGGDA